MPAAVNKGGTILVAYLPTMRTITVEMAAFRHPMHATWFDPTTGVYTVIAGSPFRNSGQRQFTPPEKGHSKFRDWVLLLEHKKD